MIVLLIITSYIILVSSLVFMYGKTHSYINLAPGEAPPEKENNEAVQSVISGLFILALSLVLSAFKLVFILLSLAGLLLILSGTRAVRRLSDQKTVLDHVKDIRVGLLFNVLGLFLVTLVLVSGPAEKAAAPVQAPAKEPEKKAEVKVKEPVKEPAKEKKSLEKTMTVKRMGYVRGGSSRRDPIIGVSVKGEKVKVLGAEEGYYYVKGDYIMGKDGRGGKTDGKFWIGGGLLE
jgi:uncharacterized protein YgiM (DUF1202 family)